MKKLSAQLLSIIGFGAVFFSLISVPWYIFGDLANPVPKGLFSEADFFAPMIRWFLGLVAYVLSGCLICLSCSALARITLVGWRQFIAEEKEKAAIAKKEAIREVGSLIAVSVDSGGLFDSATTMIETTEGFYRVFGKIDVARKGEKITIRKEFDGMFGFEFLSLAGKEYQLTK